MDGMAETAELCFDEAIALTQRMRDVVKCKPLDDDRDGNCIGHLYCSECGVHLFEMKCSPYCGRFRFTVLRLCRHLLPLVSYEPFIVGRRHGGMNTIDASDDLKHIREGHLPEYGGQGALASRLFNRFKDSEIESSRLAMLRRIGQSERAAEKAAKRATNCDSIEHFIGSMPGFKQVVVNPDVDLADGGLTFMGQPLVAIICVLPVALAVMAVCSCIGFDASFHAIRPMGCYVVLQGIIKNLAVPIGFMAMPTESCRGFEYFQRALEKIAGQLGASAVAADNR
jgi:hypothetical protein